MAKKRKQTPQSSTLLDFFGKGLTGSTAKTVKKARLTDPATSKQNLAKVCAANPEDIIVIESDDDEVICVSPRPGSKPSQVHAAMPPRSKTCVQQVADPISGELSARACPPEEPPGTDALAGGLLKVKSEPQDVPPPLTSADTPTHSTRDVSPFGYPALLVPKDVDDAVGPPPTALNECSHDEESSLQVDTLTQVVGALAETAERNMGDDELEFIDVETRVKPEVSEEVDIDLTIDEEDLPVDDNGSVESCPVCTKRLHGMTVQQIHEHVDICISAPPGPSASCVTSTPSSSKTLRPLSSLPTPQPSQVLSDASVKPEAGGVGADNNVFSTLMTSYKENEAWKEASSVEDRNFRPTKANGGRRKAPFYKVLQGMPIAVDAFRYGTIPNVTAYFLTHAHSDHYTNLSANWQSGPIYCSEGTANLIIHMLKVDPKWVHPLPMDVPTTIPNTGGVQVTLIEANHCPGSCLFLFEGKQSVNAGDSAYKSPFVGSSKTFRYLHCGDFRASPRHALHPAIKGRRIDHVYLDTTYLDPKYCFPPQPLVISACAELSKRLVQGHSVDDNPSGEKPRTMKGWFTRIEKSDKGKEKEKALAAPSKVLVVVGTYSIGKERIVKAIANALDTKVYCDSRKAAILRCQDDPELHALLTTDPLAAGVHLVPLGVIASDRLKQYIERWQGHYSKVIGFRPTGWTYTQPNGSDTLPSIPSVISRSQSRTFTHANLQPMRNSTSTLQVYGVPYSEHSSFFELTCFALSVNWGRMIATVNVGSEASRGKMAKWVERWEAERKKRGGAKVVEYRAEDYW